MGSDFSGPISSGLGDHLASLTPEERAKWEKETAAEAAAQKKYFEDGQKARAAYMEREIARKRREAETVTYTDRMQVEASSDLATFVRDTTRALPAAVQAAKDGRTAHIIAEYRGEVTCERAYVFAATMTAMGDVQYPMKFHRRGLSSLVQEPVCAMAFDLRGT